MSLAATRPRNGRQRTTVEQVRWDPECPGLGLRVRPSGAASWIVQRRVDGRMVKTTLGRADTIDREIARELARADDAHDATAARTVAVTPTLAAFAERFLADCAGRWKPLTVKRHRQDLVGRILPALGSQRVDLLSTADTVPWRDGVRGASPDRSLAVLSGLMRHAEALGLRSPGSNPCCAVVRRTRPCSSRSCASSPSPAAAAARPLASNGIGCSAIVCSCPTARAGRARSGSALPPGSS